MLNMNKSRANNISSSAIAAATISTTFTTTTTPSTPFITASTATTNTNNFNRIIDNNNKSRKIINHRQTVSSINLEDYILDMEARSSNHINPPDGDVWTQLQQKETDILLAAELGKALLEKNQELVKQQEQLIEDYSTKIEKLEQEKHVLRQKLAIAEEESDQRVLELQADLSELKNKLQAQDNAIRQAEKEKAILIDELSSQNTRLTEQIQEAHANELKLTAQIQQLKDQYNYRNTSLQEHVNSLESIKSELTLTTEKRHDLERRLQHVQEEKDSLTLALEEASDRIHMLERHAREQETKFENTLQALERSQRENNVLTERLGTDGMSSSSNMSSQCKKSLQFEMECDDDLNDSDYSDKPSQISIEARSVFIQLKSLVDSLKISHDDDSGLNSDISLESMDNTLSTYKSDGEIEFRPGMLSAMSDELTRLLLNLDAGNFKKMLDQTRNIVLEQEDEIKRNQNLIQQLEMKMTVAETELIHVKEERDQAVGDLTEGADRDDLLAKAQKDRDAANAKRTKAEVDLAKARVDLMQANSQLLESIQQKVELSQQLEQWQMDMQELIHEQMKCKLSSNRKSSGQNSSAAAAAAATAINIPLSKRVISYKLWNLFHR